MAEKIVWETVNIRICSEILLNAVAMNAIIICAVAKIIQPKNVKIVMMKNVL